MDGKVGNNSSDKVHVENMILRFNEISKTSSDNLLVASSNCHLSKLIGFEGCKPYNSTKFKMFRLNVMHSMVVLIFHKIQNNGAIKDNLKLKL